MTKPTSANDNALPRLRPTLLIGVVDAATGRVTITDPDWRPTPAAAEAIDFPGDPREA